MVVVVDSNSILENHEACGRNLVTKGSGRGRSDGIDI